MCCISKTTTAHSNRLVGHHNLLPSPDKSSNASRLETACGGHDGETTELPLKTNTGETCETYENFPSDWLQERILAESWKKKPETFWAMIFLLIPCRLPWPLITFHIPFMTMYTWPTLTNWFAVNCLRDNRVLSVDYDVWLWFPHLFASSFFLDGVSLKGI